MVGFHCILIVLLMIIQPEFYRTNTFPKLTRNRQRKGETLEAVHKQMLVKFVDKEKPSGPKLNPNTKIGTKKNTYLARSVVKDEVLHFNAIASLDDIRFKKNNAPELQYNFSNSKLKTRQIRKQEVFNSKKIQGKIGSDIQFSNFQESRLIMKRKTNKNYSDIVRQKRSASLQFLEFNDTSDYCGDILGSCRFAENKLRWLCSCDEFCDFYNDCCYDYDYQNNEKTNGGYTWQCYTTHYSNYDMSYIEKGLGFLAIGSCPDSYYNKTVIRLCEQGEIIDQGTFVMGKQNIPFKNKMCAICNGIMHFKPFQIRFYAWDDSFPILLTYLNKTSEELFKILLANANVVQYTVDKPRGNGTFLRGCFVEKPKLPTNSTSLCESYVNPVQILTPGGLYRSKNIHCAKEMNISSVDCYQESQLILDDGFPYREDFMMSILFTLSETKSEDKEECVSWSQQMSKTGECGHLGVYKDIRKNLYVSWVSTRNFTLDLLEQIAELTPWLFTVDKVTSSTLVNATIQEEGFMVNMVISLKYFKPSFLHEIEDFLDSAKERKILLTVEDLIGTQTSTFELHFGHKNFTLGKIVVNMMFRHISRLEEYAKIRLNNNRLSAWSKSVFVSTTYKDDFLEVEEIVTSDNKGVQDKNWIPEIVSYSCLSLSILALLIMIITQRKRGLLTNMCSVNTENVSISLLISYIMLMCGPKASIMPFLCYIVGCFSHYIWLTFFAFLSVSVAKICFGFYNLNVAHSRTSQGVHWKQRMKTTSIGLAIPLPIVLTSICFDRFGPSSWTSGYGGKVCSMDKYPASLAFLTGPILFSLLVSLSCLLVIICKVCFIRMETLYARKLNLYKEALIYVRLVIVSGLLWGTGVVASVIEEDWMYYVYTVVCGLHGVFISVSVLTSSRARNSGSKSTKTDK